MKCIYCGHKTKVVRSMEALVNNVSVVLRTRVCKECHKVFKTQETADNHKEGLSA